MSMDATAIFLFGQDATAPAGATAQEENPLSLFNLGIIDTPPTREAWFKKYTVKGEPVRLPTEQDRKEVDAFLRRYRGYTGPAVKMPQKFWGAQPSLQNNQNQPRR